MQQKYGAQCEALELLLQDVENPEVEDSHRAVQNVEAIFMELDE
jgi:hypothetical protein